MPQAYREVLRLEILFGQHHAAQNNTKRHRKPAAKVFWELRASGRSGDTGNRSKRQLRLPVISLGSLGQKNHFLSGPQFLNNTFRF